MHYIPCIDVGRFGSYCHSNIFSEVRRYRPYQFNFLLLGPDRPKLWQVSFNNDNLCRLVLALLWEAWIISEYDITLQTNSFIASHEIVSATHLQIRVQIQYYNTADERVHRYSNEIVSATHLQINMFIASDERVL